MALRALRSSTRGLLLRTLAQTSQGTRKVFSCGYADDASTNHGSQLERKLENLEISSQNEVAHVAEDAAQPEKSEATQFEASIKVGAPYVRFVAGRGGTARNNIEKATKTIVMLPRAAEIKSGASVVVKGASQESVDAALARIRDILQRVEKNSNLQYTHFVSLPLTSRHDLLERYRSFRDSVLAEEQKAGDYISWFPETANKESSNVTVINTNNKVSKIKSSHILDPDLEGFFSDDESSDDENEHIGSSSRRISRSLFIRPEILHITVLMLKLFTDERVNVAAKVLEGVKQRVLEILEGQQPRVLLKGIECLRGSPAEARVLCMKVQEADNASRVQQACQAIKDAYTDAGLIADVDKNQELKLHATVSNIAFTRRLSNKPFDARKILAKYRLHEWGEYPINEVHLSQRFFYDESGYYRCCGSFKLPSTVSEESSV